MIDPITEALLQETLPSDMTIQTQFKLMVDDETKKCEEVTSSGPDFDSIPNLESVDIVAALTVSPDAINENPLRLFLR